MDSKDEGVEEKRVQETRDAVQKLLRDHYSATHLTIMGTIGELTSRHGIRQPRAAAIVLQELARTIGDWCDYVDRERQEIHTFIADSLDAHPRGGEEYEITSHPTYD
tara:strand:- start:94 stop:414 length:321 start_codon:yes stop_codon:yes gene_type:complete